MEFFVHRVGDRYKLFGGIPQNWKDVSFENIAAEGGFLLSGKKTGGLIREIEVKSLRGGNLVLENPWTGAPTAEFTGAVAETDSGEVRLETVYDRIEVLSICLAPGQVVRLRRQ